MNGTVLCLVSGVFFASMQAVPEPSGPWLSFSLDRSGASPSHYELRVDEGTGRGYYRPEPQEPTGPPAVTPAPEVPISVDGPLLKKLFAAVPLVQSHRCDSHGKNIAQTGIKTLRYEGAGGAFECSYNYSNEDRINTATALFLAIGDTMQYGDRLAAKLRFDRLGLDAEMDNLQSALADGTAVDVANIAPVLAAIQNDDRVMDIVRRKATRLLESAGVTAQAAVSDSSDR